jgi:glycosyltransferase involved in cell wall biosynthesis
MIANPYLLAIVQMPFYRDHAGRLFAEQLWGKDLIRHLDYLGDFTIACPCVQQEPPPDAISLEPFKGKIKWIELPDQRSLLQSIANLPRIATTLWRAVKQSQIIHTSIAGWPIPMGWIVGPIALMQKKPLIIIVESAPWRLQPGTSASWLIRLRSNVHEAIGCWLLRKCDLPIFTQDGYRQSMLGVAADRGFVIPASWIDEAAIITDQDAERLWQKKLDPANSELHILFAGRLAAEKGLPVLLQSIRSLAAEHQPIHLDILGDGTLRAECHQASADLNGKTRVRMLGTVAYGTPLFKLLSQYHAIVVPSISDEQPRIVFDAYSQGVPVIASNTSGLRSCVQEGITGLLFTPGDPVALASVLLHGVEHREELHRLGINSIEHAREMTHRTMHLKRAVMIEELLKPSV